MRVRQLSPIGDFTFGKGSNNYLNNNAAIAQNIQTRLSSFLGDCFFDAGAGIDWWNLLGGKNQLAVILAINDTIVNTTGVTGMIQSSVNLTRSSRNLSVNYSVTTIYSTLTSTYQYNFAI